jgi:hypothetical protein
VLSAQQFFHSGKSSVEQREGFLEKLEQGFCAEISRLNQRINRIARMINGIAFII